MKISRLLPLCAAALLCSPVFAQEGDQLRVKIKELEGSARNAKEQGRAEEAKELMQQVQRLQAEMGEREGPRGAGEKLEMAKRKIDELHKAGKHDEAEQLEQKMREAMEKQGDRQRKEGGGDAERKQHVMEAVKHLHAAGLHEPAERIEQMLREHGEKPEQGERRAPEAAGQEPLKRAMGDSQEQMQRAMRDMQEQMQRALRETHEQMGKMGHAIEELRAQVAKQSGEGDRRKD